jgi:hypothetical protein
MRFPFTGWMFIRWFAGPLLAACIMNAGVNAAQMPDTPAAQAIRSLRLTMQASIERSHDDLSAPALDPIRTKADLSRIAADGPPPFRITLNDTFATEAERVAIAKWLGIRNRGRVPIPRVLLLSANAAEAAASLQQLIALSRLFESGVGRLIRGLYYRQLTYGEFARERYEFARDATTLSSAIDAAALDPDGAGPRQTLQQLKDLQRRWNTYLRRVDARQPGTVHIPGAIYT